MALTELVLYFWLLPSLGLTGFLFVYFLKNKETIDGIYWAMLVFSIVIWPIGVIAILHDYYTDWIEGR